MFVLRAASEHADCGGVKRSDFSGGGRQSVIASGDVVEAELVSIGAMVPHDRVVALLKAGVGVGGHLHHDRRVRGYQRESLAATTEHHVKRDLSAPGVADNADQVAAASRPANRSLGVSRLIVFVKGRGRRSWS